MQKQRSHCNQPDTGEMWMAKPIRGRTAAATQRKRKEAVVRKELLAVLEIIEEQFADDEGGEETGSEPEGEGTDGVSLLTKLKLLLTVAEKKTEKERNLLQDLRELLQENEPQRGRPGKVVRKENKPRKRSRSASRSRSRSQSRPKVKIE